MITNNIAYRFVDLVFSMPCLILLLIVKYISKAVMWLTVTDWMAEVYTAINTLQERVLTAQNNVKRGLANIDAWGNVPLHNRKENPDKLELLAVKERHPRFVTRRNKILDSHEEFVDILKTNYKLFFNIQDEVEVSCDIYFPVVFV